MSKKYRTKGSSGPFGAFGVLDELDDIHNQTSLQVLESLKIPAIKPSKLLRMLDPKEQKRLERKNEEERKLRKIARLEQRRAEETLGLLNLKKVPPALKVKFTEALYKEHQHLFKFLMLQTAPVELAIDPAVADATEAMRMITGSADVEISTTRMRAFLQDLVDMKMLDYLSHKLKLSKDLRQKIIDKHFTLPPVSNKGSTDLLRALVNMQQSKGDSLRSTQVPRRTN